MNGLMEYPTPNLSLPPMTEREAKEELVRRFKTNEIFGIYRHPFAHKVDGTCCLVIEEYKYSNGWKWRPKLVMADSTFEGAWYRYDREEAYMQNAEYDAEQRRRDKLCRQLLGTEPPPPAPTLWQRFKIWFLGECE